MATSVNQLNNFDIGASMRIDCDDDALGIMDKVNKELRDAGINLQFENDGLPHDGYENYALKISAMQETQDFGNKMMAK